MIELFKKIYKNTRNLGYINNSFKNLKNKNNFKKIFNVVSNYSENSELRYVGGCVRKVIKGEKVDDIDLAINMDPEITKKILKENNIKFFETGIDHGTVTAIIDDSKFEITSLRKDLITDGRHAKVEFSDSWLEDSSRRDFTINSIYADREGNLFDPHNGKKDLESGVVRFIGDPEKRIKEDYLRILRYVRFFLNYSKSDHESEIKKIIKQNIVGLKKLSVERLLDELKKLVISNGFLKINQDKFCLEIILLIFPELKNINLFKKLNNIAINHSNLKDFIFLISLMIIDDTDNTDYFLFKYNLSNKDKDRILSLKKYFLKSKEKKIFSEKNLLEFMYFNNKEKLNDIFNFELFRSKKVDNKFLHLIDNFNKMEKPIFPIKAKDLIDKYDLKEGAELGKKLKEIEDMWINNTFKISKKEIDKIVKN